MNIKRIARVLSVILIVTCVIQMLPVQALAVQTSHTNPSASTSEVEKVTIVGEEASLRGEAEKHFRLSDGSYLAVTYATPVHYMTAIGEWQEIDNRPVMATDAMGISSYQIANADKITTFASELSDGTIFSTSVGDYSVSLQIMDTSQAEDKYRLAQENIFENAYRTISTTEEKFQTFSRTAAAELEPKANNRNKSDTVEDWTIQDLTPENITSAILYENVFQNVDLRYVNSSYNIKEEIIIRQTQKSYRYDFLLTLDGLTSRLNDNGSISLVDENEITIYEIPAPYMFDGAGVYSDEVEYSILTVDQGIILTVTANASWIDDNSRTFPVTIDPTLNLVVYGSNNNTNATMYMSYVNENSPNTSAQGTDTLYVGYGIQTHELRGYIYVNNLPTLPEGAVVTRAKLNLYMGTYSNSSLPQMPVGIYEVISDRPDGLSYQEWINHMTWNTRAEYNSNNLIDYVTASSSTIYYSGNYGPMSWDLTKLVKKWYNENTENRTITFGTTKQYSSSNCAVCVFQAYGESTTPTLVVSYRNNIGIEPYYTYTTLGAGSGGTAYIADATGQLKIVNQLLGYASSVNPFSLNLVYNSDYFVNSQNVECYPMQDLGLSMSMGAGWRLDCVQKVVSEIISGTTYLKYYDGDGTVHYFARDYSIGNDYYDEDGLGLKIVAKNNKYEMSDDSGNVWTFVNNYLTEYKDENGNRLLFNYENNQLTTIVQRNACVSSGNVGNTIATLFYDGSKLIRIKDAANNEYTLSYAENGKQLISINSDSKDIARYEYAGSRVTKISDAESMYSLVFSYSDSGQVCEFCEQVPLTQNDGEFNTGARVQVNYSNNAQTIYQDAGNNRVFDDSDDILTHYLFDYAGRTVNAYTTDASGKIIGASNAVYSGSGSTDRTNNRILRTATIGVVSQQLLRNSSFEANSDEANQDPSRVQQNPRTGYYSVLLPDIMARRVQLELNQTYTFSAYVDTSSATSFSEQGVTLSVSCGTNSWTSTPVCYRTSDNNKWTRISVTFTTGKSALCTLYIRKGGITGPVYLDDLQLEVGGSPSNYNLLENSNFAQGKTSWSAPDTSTITDGALKIYGSPDDANAYASQAVKINLPSTETYVLSGWVTADAVPDTQNTVSDSAQDINKQCGLRAAIHYADNTTEYHYVPFNVEISEKQFVSYTIVPNPKDAQGNPVVKTVSEIVVTCAYETNANSASFDDISLVREATQTMKYDDEGNLVSVTTSGLNVDINTYQGGNLIKTVTGDQGVFEYTYDTTYKHRLLSVTNRADESSDTEWIKQSMAYDSSGNVISTALVDVYGNTMSTSAIYGSNGNLLNSVTDATGATVTYGYDSYGDTTAANSLMWGLPTSVTAPNGTITHSAYDLYGRVTQTSVADLATLVYNYTNGNLTSITRTAGNKSQIYALQYDSFGKTTSISVGNRELAAYEYLAGNGLLEKQTYGNGHEVTFTYDDLGRTKTVTHKDGATLSYTYTGDGQLHSVTERKNGGTTTTYLYQYDTLGNLVGSVKLVGGSPVLRTYHSYNDDNKLSSQGWQIGNDTFTQTYTYGAWDGNLSSLVVSDNNSTTSDITVSYSYDGLRRLSSVDNGILSREYSYNSNGTQTTAQVGTLTYTGLSSNFTYSYAYDVSGNIHTYSDSNGEVTYTYDAQGQLTKAVIGSTTYRYSYDNAGNILTANGHTYTYGNPSWADLLTAYDGILISYDEIGNPESYYNGKHWEFDWIQGRQLKRAYTTSPTEDTTIDYTYDADGLRTGKIVTVETFSDHPHTYTVSSVVEPTCTTSGYTVFVCVCGKQIKDNYISALGHNYSNNGMISNTCTRCGYKPGDSITPIDPILPPGGNITMGGDGSDATEVMSTSSTEGRTLESTKRMEYQYIYAGTKLVRLVVTTRMNNGTPTTQTLDFTYDAGGIPLTVTTGGAVYYYITNLQGDVMAITNSSGTAVVKYRYDPYGKLISTTGSKASTLGKVNPLTYRSYVYDTESTLYYLQSRYYDSSIGRFINADALVSTGQGVLGNNMFAYCGNNPVNAVDITGYSPSKNIFSQCLDGVGVATLDYIIYYLHPESNANLDNPAWQNHSVSNSKYVAVATFEELIAALNATPGYIENIYIYLHGDADNLSFYYANYYSSGDIESCVETIDISGKVFLFSCKGGRGDLAATLASSSGQTVIASVYKVSFGNGFARCGWWNYYTECSLYGTIAWYSFYPDGTQSAYSLIKIPTRQKRRQLYVPSKKESGKIIFV